MNAIAKRLYEEARRLLGEELRKADSARRMSAEDAIEAEGAMISRYDTFKEEAQYLAGGQMKRVLSIRTAIDSISTTLLADLKTEDRVVLGSLVTLETSEPEQKRYYLLTPENSGGLSLTHPEKDLLVTTVNPMSPIGKILLRKEVGDEVRLPQSDATWEIMVII